MDGGTLRVAGLAAVLAAAIGAGTAWFMVSRMDLPGGPVIARTGPDDPKEMEELRRKVESLGRDLAEARLNLAASRAFPHGYPPRPPEEPDTSILGELKPEEKARFEKYYRAVRAREDAEAARALRGAEEASLRQRLERAAKAAPMDEGTRDAAVRVLLEGSDRMRELYARATGGGPGDADWTRTAEEVGKETRTRLAEVLSPEQLKALEQVLDEGAPPAQPQRR